MPSTIYFEKSHFRAFWEVPPLDFLRVVQWTVSEQLALEAPLPPLDLASACPATFCLWDGTDFRPTCLGAVVEGSARACESTGSVRLSERL